MERVAGVELVEDSCALAARTGHGVFLLGSAPGVAATAAQRLRNATPAYGSSGRIRRPWVRSSARKASDWCA